MRRGLADDVAAARVLIEAGRVRVGGAVALKATRQVAPGEPVLVDSPPPRFVSRAGWKLEGALADFDVDPSGRDVLDAGSSTGGFTDCVLQYGARTVTCIDVGTNQLHERLRADSRIRLFEQTDIRDVHRRDLAPSIDLVTADLSFISVVPLAAHLLGLAGDDGELVLLVKPQFEARRREVDISSGVITDPAIWRRVLIGVTDALGGAGAGIMGVMASEVRGTGGNCEFFVHARPGVRDDAVADGECLVDRAVRDVAS